MTHPIMQCKTPLDIFYHILQYEFDYACSQGKPFNPNHFINDLVQGRLNFVTDPENIHHLGEWFKQSLRHRIVFASWLQLGALPFAHDNKVRQAVFNFLDKKVQDGTLVSIDYKNPVGLFYDELKAQFDKDVETFKDELTDPEVLAEFKKQYFYFGDLFFAREEYEIDKTLEIVQNPHMEGLPYEIKELFQAWYLADPREINYENVQLALVNFLSQSQGNQLLGATAICAYDDIYYSFQPSYGYQFAPYVLERHFEPISVARMTEELDEPMDFVHQRASGACPGEMDQARTWHRAMMQACVNSVRGGMFKGDHLVQIEDGKWQDPAGKVAYVRPTEETIDAYDAVCPKIRELEIELEKELKSQDINVHCGCCVIESKKNVWRREKNCYFDGLVVNSARTAWDSTEGNRDYCFIDNLWHVPAHRSCFDITFLTFEEYIEASKVNRDGGDYTKVSTYAEKFTIRDFIHKNRWWVTDGRPYDDMYF